MRHPSCEYSVLPNGYYHVDFGGLITRPGERRPPTNESQKIKPRNSKRSSKHDRENRCHCFQNNGSPDAMLEPMWDLESQWTQPVKTYFLLCSVKLELAPPPLSSGKRADYLRWVRENQLGKGSKDFNLRLTPSPLVKSCHVIQSDLLGGLGVLED